MNYFKHALGEVVTKDMLVCNMPKIRIKSTIRSSDTGLAALNNLDKDMASR